MPESTKPFVSIVTPAYNSEKYLPQCIESVLSQTYDNWEYIVVNNCSTDGTLEIAQKYSRMDSRIRIHTNDKFLSMVDNWNHALRQLSLESIYCKVIHADDFLFPNCIEKMVNLAEDHPNIGLIGAYRLDGNSRWGKVRNDGLPHQLQVLPGRTVCRHRLMDRHLSNNFFSLFGSPSCFLIPSDIIRKNDPFYDEDFMHTDLESYFKILKDHDFGFVHQVLTFTRLHDESYTETYAIKVDSATIEELKLFSKYGPIFLTSKEFSSLYRIQLRKYQRYFIRKLLQGNNKRLIDYHKNELHKLDINFNARQMIIALLIELLQSIFLQPKMSAQRLTKIKWFK